MERLAHVFGIDRVVVGDGQLDRLAAVLVDEILEPLAEDPGDEIEHLVPGGEETGGGRLEPEDGLALHDDHVVLGAKHLLQEPAGAREELDEGRIVVVEDRPRRVAEGLIRDLDRAGGQIQPRPGCPCCHRLLHVLTFIVNPSPFCMKERGLPLAHRGGGGGGGERNYCGKSSASLACISAASPTADTSMLAADDAAPVLRRPRPSPLARSPQAVEETDAAVLDVHDVDLPNVPAARSSIICS